ncbi:FMN-binding protein, partial [Porphyromonas loveana]
DCNTIFGTDFGHQGETPGLGAEITTSKFSGQFHGKEIFKGGEFKSVAVVKAGHKADDKDYVDGISGGTLTSDGVNNMLDASLRPYVLYLTNNAKK